jgi:hypothetical protein
MFLQTVRGARTNDALSVLLVFRKWAFSCWGMVGDRTVVGTVSPAKPTGSGGTSARMQAARQAL